MARSVSVDDGTPAPAGGPHHPPRREIAHAPDGIGEPLPLRGENEGQIQDQEGHGRQAWRLPQTLRGIEVAGQQAVLLVRGSLIFPDTEEVTSSNLVPPTTFTHVIAGFRHDVR